MTLFSSRVSPGPALAPLALLLALGTSTSAHANDKVQPKWTRGPATVELGSRVAEIRVPDRYIFADGADTKKLMETMGNPASGTEVGLLSPGGEGEDWFIVFEYHDVGFVKDDDKDKIDAAAILKGIREGTEEANEQRKKRGLPTLSVVGWDEAPHYDSLTHNLVWALLARSSNGHQVVNYNVRVLGREGYMSATLVTDPGTLSGLKPRLNDILSGFSYKGGQRYAEWRPGDKVAKYGLAALVAGGAGVAAAKLGLFAVIAKFLAKSWKVVVLAFAGLVGAVKRFFGRREGETTPS